MKINKILIILLFPFIAEVIISCCDCIEPLIEHYTNKTLLIKNIDNSGSEPVVTTANSVPKEAFGIRTKLRREKVAFLKPTKSLFIPTAFATSCDCPPEKQLYARDSIISIQLYTLNDFDTNHPSNSEVSDYFKIFQGASFSTIKDYLTKYNTVLYNDNELDFEFDLLLMIPPSLNKSHSFKLKITISDGRVFEEASTPIELL